MKREIVLSLKMCDFDDNVIIFDPVKEYGEDEVEVFSYDEENSEYLQDSDDEYEAQTEESKDNLNKGKLKRKYGIFFRENEAKTIQLINNEPKLCWKCHNAR